MPFTVAIHSKDRLTGNPSVFTYALSSALPRGNYKATFRITSNEDQQCELLIRWPGMKQQFSANAVEGFTTVLVFDLYGGTGVAYFQDPGQNIEVGFVDSATRQPLANYAESTILVHFEKI